MAIGGAADERILVEEMQEAEDVILACLVGRAEESVFVLGLVLFLAGKVPEKDLAVERAKGDAVAAGRKRDGEVGFVVALVALIEHVKDFARVAVEDGDAAGHEAEAGDRDAILFWREREGKDGAALFAPRGPAEGFLLGAEALIGERP